MKPTTFAVLCLKILGLAFLLMILNGIGSTFLPAEAAGDPAAPPSGSFLSLVVAVMLLQAIALAYPALIARWRGWRLAVAIFLLYFGTVTFQSQIESLVYLGDKLPAGMVPGLFAMGLFAAAIFSPVLVLVLGRWKADPDAARAPNHLPTSPREWAWKTVVGGLVFLALYYLFGYYVAWQNPAVRDYYEGSDPGSFVAQIASLAEGLPWMLPLQYARGLLWTGFAILALAMMRGRWWQAGLALSFLFLLPALYLLLPNPLMPEAVRTAHLVETAPYQFFFGWFAAWLFRRDAPGKPAARRSARPSPAAA